MKETYIKARVPAALHEAARVRAGREGVQLSTYYREAIARDLRAETAPTAPPPPPAIDHEARTALMEIRLLLRELAMASNAQIVARVAAQLKSQSQQSI